MKLSLLIFVFGVCLISLKSWANDFAQKIEGEWVSSCQATEKGSELETLVFDSDTARGAIEFYSDPLCTEYVSRQSNGFVFNFLYRSRTENGDYRVWVDFISQPGRQPRNLHFRFFEEGNGFVVTDFSLIYSRR